MFGNREPRPREADWTTEHLQHIFLPSQHLDDGRNQADNHRQSQTPPRSPLVPIQADVVNTEGTRALNSGSLRKQRKRRDRKLDLTKCDRCRFDKQKCTPTTRVWPAKCDRCMKKSFPCSEGRRIERTTKFDGAVSRIEEPAQQTEDESIGSDVKDWLFLVEYRRLILAGLDDLTILGVKTRLDFVGFVQQRQSIMDILSLTSVIRDLDHAIDSRGADLMGKFHSSRDGRAQILFHITSSPLSISQPAYECYLCSGEYIQKIEDCKRHGMDCRVFGMMISHLVNVIKDDYPSLGRRCPVHSFRDFEIELDILLSMAKWMSGRAMTLISKSCSSLSGLLIPIQIFRINRLPQFWDRVDYSLTQRSKSHALLDMYLYQGVQPSLQRLEELWSSDPSTDINQQDFLGRTILYIACLMPWFGLVRLILQKGAKTDLPTLYGTLPIQAAASVGETEICKLLLQYGSKSDLKHADVHGLWACDYAKNETIEQILFPQGDESEEEDDRMDEENADGTDEDDNVEHAKKSQNSLEGTTYDPPVESEERPQEPLNSGNIDGTVNPIETTDSTALPRDWTTTGGPISKSEITIALIKVCQYAVRNGYAKLPALGDLYWKLVDLTDYLPEGLAGKDAFEESIMLCITAATDIPSLNAWVQSDPDGTRDFGYYVSCITSISGLMGFTPRDDQALKATLRSAWQHEAALGQRIRQRLREMSSSQL